MYILAQLLIQVIDLYLVTPDLYIEKHDCIYQTGIVALSDWQTINTLFYPLKNTHTHNGRIVEKKGKEVL